MKAGIVARLEQLAESARLADRHREAQVLAQTAKAVTLRLANAEAKETLRDRLAMAALSGLLTQPWDSPPEVAERAYLMADAMMAAREQK